MNKNVLPISGRNKRRVYRRLTSLSYNHICILFALFSCFIIPSLQCAAQQIKFTMLTTKDGLSSNSVNSIIKDRFGLIWIATLDGLNRYDGKECKVYRLGGAPRTELGSKEINVELEDTRGNLWVGTMGGGLYRYDRQLDTFYRFDNNNKRLSNPYVTTLYCDTQGYLWVGTMGGLDKIDIRTYKIIHVNTGSNAAGQINSSNITYICPDKHNRIWVATFGGLYCSDLHHTYFNSFRHNADDINSLPSDYILTLKTDKSGVLWVGTLNGLARLEADGRHFKTFRYDYNNPNSLCSNIIYGIAAADSSTLWIASEGGLNIIDLKTEKVTRYQHDPRNPYSINSKSVHSIFIDPKGIFWVGTYEGGVMKYDKNLTLFNIVRNSEFDPNGLNWPFVSCFAQRNDGDIYVGCDGGGVSLFHTQTGLFSRIALNSQKRITSGGLPILCMMIDHSQTLWIGTFLHGLFRYNQQSGSYKQYTFNGGNYGANQNNIFCLTQDSRGQIWIGTNGAGVNVMDPATEKITSMTPVPHKPSDIRLPLNGFIRAFQEDQDGCMWIASYGTGVVRYHPQSGKFDIYNPATTGFPLEHILSMLIDRRGNVWIGTGGDGLFKLNIRDNKITPYTRANGLPNGVIHKVIEDDNSNIWMSTNRGLYRLDPSTGYIKNYSVFNGLQSDSFIDGSGLKAANGNIYFGGIEGFNYFKASDIKLNSNVPPVILSGLSVNNDPVFPGKDGPLNEAIDAAHKATISYKENFAISFIALNYTLSSQNRYKYLLEGFNKNWVNAGTNTTAYYTNLDPGTYTFKVEACNNDGVWNNTPAEIKIIIPPPFWRTGYAYFIYVLVFVGTLLFIRHKGIQKVKAKLKVEQDRQAAEAQHELDDMKIKFLTNLSHEFRTPVSLIVAPADKLLSLHPDQQTTAQLKVIKRNSRRLLNLVNQLLDFRKMEDHELQLHLIKGEIVQFIREIAESFRDLAEAKKIHFSFVSNVEEACCNFDHDKVERILFNLLSNAFKFTPSGGRVSVTFTDEFDHEQSLHHASIQVKDSGIGLSQESINRIFDRFFQAHAPSSILNQGSGIGLAIVKELVNLHGGEITVNSELKKGTAFNIIFPLTACKSDAEVQPVSAAMIIESAQKIKTELPVNGSDTPHVLVIEDNDELRNYLVEMLGGYYKMSAAIDGRDGWHKSLALHPDVIISDVSMPYMDGIALSKKLKGDKRTSHIPIILLTAHARHEDQLSGLASGVSDYVTKPFNFDILNIKIKNLLDLNKKLKETYQKQIKVLPEESRIGSSVEKFIKEVVIYVEQNIHDPKFSIEDVSHHFGMSRGSFYNKVIEFTGQPPVEFIRNLKLEKATVMLKKTDSTIAEIAYQTGFPTPHYFSKSFKLKYGVLPSDYRQQFKTAVV